MGITIGVSNPMVPRGAYAGGTTYGLNDLVTSGGSLYRSLAAANIGHTPASSPSWWELEVSKGDAGGGGSAGDVGPPGPDVPAVDNTTDLGDLTHRFRDLFLSRAIKTTGDLIIDMVAAFANNLFIRNSNVTAGAVANVDIDGDISAAGGFRQTLLAGMHNVPAGSDATYTSSNPQLCGGQGGVAVFQWVAPRDGSIMALSAALSDSPVGSTLRVQVAVASGGPPSPVASVLVDLSSTTSGSITFAKDLHAFSAGDTIYIAVFTGSGWTGTDRDLSVAVEIEC